MTPVPAIKAFFDEHLNTISYLVADPAMRAGKFPPADENGVRYLMIPVRLSA